MKYRLLSVSKSHMGSGSITLWDLWDIWKKS